MTKKIVSTDDAWDNRELGADEQHVSVAPEELANKINNATGTQLISIRLQQCLINDLKYIASLNKGIGYQTLLKQILQRFVENEKQVIRSLYE